MTTTSAEWGAQLSQEALMLHDTVLVVDNADNVIGSASKKDSHIFDTSQPHGILHRAFSVFLFDESDGRLLLHQRSADKITFPNVWTNTCCSHPLHGMVPNEVDDAEHVQNGTVPGIRYAAVRKLKHELGLDGVDPTQFKFLTRLHYWAADTITHGTKSPWGEHEIDYVLFWVIPQKNDIQLKPNPEEIQSIRWVNAVELEDMLGQKDLLFSPWFRLIYYKWLKDCWWKDLKITMETDKWIDYQSIHEFDPPREHYGGQGDAKPLFECSRNTMSTKKQGAYGKIPTHQESKLEQLLRLDEVFSALSLLYLKPLESNLSNDYVVKTFNIDDLSFCDHILGKVSRSFAAVIRQLPGVMLVDVTVFYLVLRALDTIEDDTTAFETHEIKVGHLRNFHRNALEDPNWSMTGVGAGDERRLLEEFPKCHRIFQQLQPKSREIIRDITKQMADGMAEFVSMKLGQGTTDVPQYNLYCHYVAGLVGIGLSRLFSASGLEDPKLALELDLSNQMGLFLQKTNIIRDYLEDYVDERAFWPQSIWRKYSASGDLGYFTNQSDPEVRQNSIACLNELVTDALELVPDCLAYLSKLQCREIFRFCAIPQVMAIATLDKVYANPDVFTGVVKIRKGLSCKLILQTNNLIEVHQIFFTFARSIQQKLLNERKRGIQDPNFDRTLRACETIQRLTKQNTFQLGTSNAIRLTSSFSLVLASAFVHRIPGLTPLNTNNQKMIRAVLIGAASILYYCGPWARVSNLNPAEIIRPRNRLCHE